MLISLKNFSIYQTLSHGVARFRKKHDTTFSNLHNLSVSFILNNKSVSTTFRIFLVLAFQIHLLRKNSKDFYLPFLLFSFPSLIQQQNFIHEEIRFKSSRRIHPLYFGFVVQTKTQLGVNFTNVLRAAFTPTYPKTGKKAA